MVGSAVVVEARGLRSASGGGSRAKPEGRPRPRSARSLARARSLAYAAIGWPGVFPWIRRSRLDIDKWLTEGEPNTAPLLHMQGHPFVRAGVRRGRWTLADEERNTDGENADDDRFLRPLRRLTNSRLSPICRAYACVARVLFAVRPERSVRPDIAAVG